MQLTTRNTGYEPQNAKNLDESGPTGIYFAGKQLKSFVLKSGIHSQFVGYYDFAATRQKA
jgi:hypothetical protein